MPEHVARTQVEVVVLRVTNSNQEAEQVDQSCDPLAIPPDVVPPSRVHTHGALLLDEVPLSVPLERTLVGALRSRSPVSNQPCPIPSFRRPGISRLTLAAWSRSRRCGSSAQRSSRHQSTTHQHLILNSVRPSQNPSLPSPRRYIRQDPSRHRREGRRGG